MPTIIEGVWLNDELRPTQKRIEYFGSTIECVDALKNHLGLAIFFTTISFQELKYGGSVKKIENSFTHCTQAELETCLEHLLEDKEKNGGRLTTIFSTGPHRNKKRLFFRIRILRRRL